MIEEPEMNLRTYTYGIMTGIAMVAVCFVLVSQIAGVRWQPVPTADELYGCTIKQQAPNGDCP